MKISVKKLEALVVKFPEVKKDYSLGENIASYKTNERLFAIINEDKNPLRISLRCDPKLSTVLRERYIEVMPGYHLSKKHWNTIVISGQLDLDDLKGLIVHSYELARQII